MVDEKNKSFTEGHQPAAPDSQVDPAMKSLADALQVSFKILSLIMVFFIILFLATGIDSIGTQEKGIIKVFGKVTRVVPEGFVYNWPFPIGEIQKVSTVEKSLEIDSFWMFETKEDKMRAVAERRRNKEGLEPGIDGYLFTGDRNLLHIRYNCRYQVVKPEVYVSRFSNPENVLKDILKDATIEVAATSTADSILLESEKFLKHIKTLSQRRLDKVMGFDPDSGIHPIRINQVQLSQTDSKIWPLGAFDAYEKAQRAKNEKQTAINKALADARQELISAIGGTNYSALVGEPWEADKQPSESPAYNLIGLYSDLVDQADAAAAKAEKAPTEANKLAARTARKKEHKMLDKINRILTSSAVGGEASKVIAQAESDKTKIIQSAQRRATRFEDLYSQYKKAPKLFLEKMWAGVFDELMNSPTVEKWYFSPGEMGSVVRINQDPQVQQLIRDYRLKQQKELKKKEAAKR